MEIQEEDTLRVRKQDGTLDVWNDDKLIVSMIRAGLSNDDSRDVLNELLNWAIDSSENNIIESNKLRDKVIEILQRDHPLVANTYQTYKKG